LPAPYDVEATKREVEHAVKALVAQAESNNMPIVVYDDGGLATEVIASKFPSDLHRFRIIEITKSGERLGKQALHLNRFGEESGLSAKQREHMHQRFLDAKSWDPPSREAADQVWQQRRISQYAAGGERHIDSAQMGFAYYTYSNTAYKRDAMTPLYTEQVNRSLFDAIARGTHPIKNKRVAMIGGGAMGLASAKELREKGYEVTFVEKDPKRAELLVSEGFLVSELKPALKGRGIVLEMSGVKNIIGINELYLIEDGAFVAHGSSKDNRFDMKSLGSMATKRVAWDEHNGQRTATYHFDAAGISKELHFLGDGFTISHGGKAQNVPLPKFLPEVDRLVNLGVYALTQREVSFYPVITAPEHAMDPSTAATAP